ncbi:hypothetical protein SLEP1_g30480 [Rubroshorea leprosula]|uniref:DJ-1/PfpI domain-containing protein n=1 Tax=Rubroshorea leprosula TaxID=152421 RepID=A0AAV5K9X4_9ROSI|nr:hypothetical protein SLEP1_g30480 [Rubroshorea leprosula]
MMGFVIPGGWAPECLAMDSFVVDIVRKFSNSQKPIASICHVQLILAAAEVVKGCKFTAFPTVRSAIIAAGAFWVEPENNAASVLDGNIISGATYEGHPEFIQPFVKALGGIITGAGRQKYSVSL